jgi:hypothetical protein
MSRCQVGRAPVQITRSSCQLVNDSVEAQADAVSFGDWLSCCRVQKVWAIETRVTWWCQPARFGLRSGPCPGSVSSHRSRSRPASEASMAGRAEDLLTGIGRGARPYYPGLRGGAASSARVAARRQRRRPTGGLRLLNLQGRRNAGGFAHVTEARSRPPGCHRSGGRSCLQDRATSESNPQESPATCSARPPSRQTAINSLEVL